MRLALFLLQYSAEVKFSSRAVLIFLNLILQGVIIRLLARFPVLPAKFDVLLARFLKILSELPRILTEFTQILSAGEKLSKFVNVSLFRLTVSESSFCLSPKSATVYLSGFGE